MYEPSSAGTRATIAASLLTRLAKNLHRKSLQVVITCYNQGRFLPESIGSVLSQTRRPDEILLIDDGSTDNTHDEARRFRR